MAIDRFIKFNETKEILGCGADYLYKQFQSGRLNGIKLAGKWATTEKDLEKYIRQQPSNKKQVG